jgi:hypothetical protein
MANSLSSSLVLDTLAEATLTTLGNRLAPLRAFSTDFTTDPLTQNAYVQVRKANAAGAVQTNPTNFETGDTNVTNCAVQVKHYSKSYNLSSQELNQGFRLEQLAAINAQVLANKIIDIALAPITATNFPTNVTVAQASLSTANVRTLWGAVAKSSMRHLILDGTAFAQLLPVDTVGFGINGPASSSYRPGAYGFDAIILNTRWDGAGTNIYGFAVGPEAVAAAAGLPMVDPGVASMLAGQRTITLPDLGISVQLNTWGSLSSRAAWASLDIMFGAALGDNTAGAHVKSA